MRGGVLIPAAVVRRRSLIAAAVGLAAVSVRPGWARAADPPLPEVVEEGFVPLFNGSDMTGWVGNVT